MVVGRGAKVNRLAPQFGNSKGRSKIKSVVSQNKWLVKTCWCFKDQLHIEPRTEAFIFRVYNWIYHGFNSFIFVYTFLYVYMKWQFWLRFLWDCCIKNIRHKFYLPGNWKIFNRLWQKQQIKWNIFNCFVCKRRENN